MPWVSVNGAGILLQILPIAILIIAVEARATARRPRVKVGRFMYSRYSAAAVGIGAFVGALSAAVCWTAVNDGTPLTGLQAWIVSLGAPLAFSSAGYVLIELIWQLIEAERVGLDALEAPVSTAPVRNPASGPTVGKGRPTPRRAQRKKKGKR
jgi:hypothetical protein